MMETYNRVEILCLVVLLLCAINLSQSPPSFFRPAGTYFNSLLYYRYDDEYNNNNQQHQSVPVFINEGPTTVTTRNMLQTTFPLYSLNHQSLDYLHYRVPEELAEERAKINTNSRTLWYHAHWLSLKHNNKDDDRCYSIMNQLAANNNNTSQLRQQFQLMDDVVNNIVHRNYTIRILITDSKDMGGGSKLFDCIKQVSNLLGNENVFLASRALVRHRDFSSFDVKTKNQSLQEGEIPIKIQRRQFSELNGTLWNYNTNGKKQNLSQFIHNGFVAKHEFSVRNDLKKELDNLIMANRSTTTIKELSFHPVSIDDYFFDYSNNNRHKDVAHFWDVEPNNEYGQLRNRVTQTVQSLISNKEENNLTGTAGLVSSRSKIGRKSVSSDYAKSLLNHKIIVVSQRDYWEDHLRLWEGLISGAMVMSDPMTHMATGLEENRSIVIYHSLEDLKRKILFYLKDEDGSRKRIQIARAGMEVALERHTGRNHIARLMLGRWPNDLSQAAIPALHGTVLFNKERKISF